jgi:uncharacterized repeat protein (TIGR03803 family)
MSGSRVLAPEHTARLLLPKWLRRRRKFPQTGLIQASDGNFYGTTILGGVYGNGTIFKITPTGTLTLYNVCSESSCSDGNYLYAGLTEATDCL